MNYPYENLLLQFSVPVTAGIELNKYTYYLIKILFGYIIPVAGFH